MDTLGHSDAPAACIEMEGSGRAAPSVKENECRRKGHAHRGREWNPSGTTGLVRHDVLNLLPPLEWAKISKLVLDLSMASGPLRPLGAWKSSGLNSSSDEFQATLINEVFTDGSLQIQGVFTPQLKANDVCVKLDTRIISRTSCNGLPVSG